MLHSQRSSGSETLAAPLLLLVGIALLVWAAGKVGGVGEILRQSERLGDRSQQEGSFLLGTFLPWLTAMVGYWATLSLNIPDFTRFARSQRDQALGQVIGLLTTMPLFAFVGVAVTTATISIYGEAIWKSGRLAGARGLMAKTTLCWAIAAMLILALATLSTNIAANVVAPANSFSSLAARQDQFPPGRTPGRSDRDLDLPLETLGGLPGWANWLLRIAGGRERCSNL